MNSKKKISKAVIAAELYAQAFQRCETTFFGRIDSIGILKVKKNDFYKNTKFCFAKMVFAKSKSEYLM